MNLWHRLTRTAKQRHTLCLVISPILGGIFGIVAAPSFRYACDCALIFVIIGWYAAGWISKGEK